jgi:hypothetical protein
MAARSASTITQDGCTSAQSVSTPTDGRVRPAFQQPSIPSARWPWRSSPRTGAPPANWAETPPGTAKGPRQRRPGCCSRGLEASNVDITTQLVNMITAQRNFQANAQMISTSDQITQTIINIR